MKNPNGLPDWFSLDNYQEIALISPLDWYENLHKRRMFFVYTKISQKSWPEGQAWRIEDAKQRLLDIIKIITEKPIIRAKHDKIIYGRRNTVEPLSNREVTYNFDELKRNAPQIFFDYLELEKESRDAAHTKGYRDDVLRSFFEEKCKPWESDQAVLSVQLNATDEHIIQDFKNWLASTRKNWCYVICNG